MSSKLRIAVWYNLPSGGGKRALNDHLKGLKARGHEIVAWRPPVPQVDYLPVSEIVEEHEIPLDVKASRRGGQIGWVRQGLDASLALREAMIAHAQAAAREIEAGGFDVLFANTCLNYYAPWIGRYARLPKLLYLQEPNRVLYEAPHTPWPALPQRPSEARSLRGRYRDMRSDLRNVLDVQGVRRQAADEVENARTYDRILVNSSFSRESVLRAYDLNAEVCYLGVDADRFENRRLPRERFVISVGTFHKTKNPEFVVRAIATIRENRPALVWVANSVFEDERTRVEALAKDLGVDLQVRQYVPDADLLDLLNRATATVYAPRLEPFGYGPLEANACGLPAVVVSEGGVKETVVDGLNGLVVPHHPEAMGAAIAGLLARPEEARAMGERAAKHVREIWSLERATDRLERNLLEVANKPPVG